MSGSCAQVPTWPRSATVPTGQGRSPAARPCLPPPPSQGGHLRPPNATEDPVLLASMDRREGTPSNTERISHIGAVPSATRRDRDSGYRAVRDAATAQVAVIADQDAVRTADVATVHVKALSNRAHGALALRHQITGRREGCSVSPTQLRGQLRSCNWPLLIRTTLKYSNGLAAGRPGAAPRPD
jgi:hypothetical protein